MVSLSHIYIQEGVLARFSCVRGRGLISPVFVRLRARNLRTRSRSSRRARATGTGCEGVSCCCLRAHARSPHTHSPSLKYYWDVRAFLDTQLIADAATKRETLMEEKNDLEAQAGETEKELQVCVPGAAAATRANDVFKLLL